MQHSHGESQVRKIYSKDKCPQCNDIWLDKGELEDIQVAQEIHDENTNKVKRKPIPTVAGFECPKCGFAQEKGDDCIKCGIFFEKYAAIQAEQVKLQVSLEKELREPENPIPAKDIKVPSGLGTIGLIGFVRDEIKDIKEKLENIEKEYKEYRG